MKDGITGDKWPVNFACDFDFHVNPGFFDMPRKSATWETALLPPKGGHAVDFFARKIRRLRPGSNQRSWVPEASMLTTRPPKPLSKNIYCKNDTRTFQCQNKFQTEHPNVSGAAVQNFVATATWRPEFNLSCVRL